MLSSVDQLRIDRSTYTQTHHPHTHTTRTRRRRRQRPQAHRPLPPLPLLAVVQAVAVPVDEPPQVRIVGPEPHHPVRGRALRCRRVVFWVGGRG